MKIKRIKIILILSAVMLLTVIGARAMINGLGAKAEVVTNATDSAGNDENGLAVSEFAGTDSALCETQNGNGATASICVFNEVVPQSEVTDWRKY